MCAASAQACLCRESDSGLGSLPPASLFRPSRRENQPCKDNYPDNEERLKTNTLLIYSQQVQLALYARLETRAQNDNTNS